jgi:D-serine deaminase-like pyridoxal phosphate-dependent protein
VGGASVRAVSVPHPRLQLDDVVGGVRVDHLARGFPAKDVALREVATQGWTFDDLEPPVLLLREDALRHNLALMAAFCDRSGVDLAPHGKTSMAPQLWARQLEAGAWGITAATASQARVMREVGVRRIVIANELVDRASIDWAASALHDPEVELLCYVDSARGVETLDARLADANAPRRLDVLVELGYLGGRTGARTVKGAIGVAERVRASSTLRLAGVAGYEGLVCRDRSEACLDRVREYLDAVRGLGEALVNGGGFDDGVVLTAGGSAFFDVVVDRLHDMWRGDVPARVILRSGCYLTHDSGLYERLSPFAGESESASRFRSAMEVWGPVLSRPERRMAIVGFGRRDVPFDQGMPIPVAVRSSSGDQRPLDGCVVTDLNDQHAFIRLDEDVALDVGDLVKCGISHPCSAFDRWRVIPVLDENDRVVDAVATFF